MNAQQEVLLATLRESQMETLRLLQQHFCSKNPRIDAEGNLAFVCKGKWEDLEKIVKAEFNAQMKLLIDALSR